MKNNKKKSDIQEKKQAKLIGGKTHPFSGGLFDWQEDASSKNILMQCKRTDKKQIIIKLSDLKQLQNNAETSDKYPVFAIEIGDKNYYVIDKDLFEMLLEKLEEENG